MPLHEKTVIDASVPDFDISDTFLSRTDTRGVIIYANATFMRLAGFDRPALNGAPHRIIRHPDMPKAAFRLFWDTLHSGQPFCAYVKNRANDGRYYWVFAVAVPVDGGYLSVRFKPTTVLLDTIKDLYARLLKSEHDHDTDPTVGGQTILTAVRDLGFRDYQAFMGYALATELSARAAQLGQIPNASIKRFQDIGQYLTEISDEVGKVRKLFEGISSSPTNLGILGSRLTVGRESMREVARNYDLLSADLLACISALSDGLGSLLETAFAGRVGYCASVLYADAINDFRWNEPDAGSSEHTAELAFLTAALGSFEREASEGVSEISKRVEGFVMMGAHLRRLLSGLAVTRVICRIEAAKVTEYNNNIDDIAARLGVFQDELSLSLDRIFTACHKITANLPSTATTQELMAING